MFFAQNNQVLLKIKWIFKIILCKESINCLKFKKITSVFKRTSRGHLEMECYFLLYNKKVRTVGKFMNFLSVIILTEDRCIFFTINLITTFYINVLLYLMVLSY